MDNPMTPRLVGLVRRARKAAYDKADAHNSSAPLGVDELRPESTLYWELAESISRLMAEGGLVGAGAAPLAEVVASKSWAWRMAAMLRFLRQHHGECIGDHPEWLTKIDALLEGPSLVEQQEITSALQASEGCGSSNPVDDGAVERARAVLLELNGASMKYAETTKDAARYPRDTAFAKAQAEASTRLWKAQQAALTALEAAEPPPMTESKAQDIATIRDALFFFTESNVRHYSGSCASKRQDALVALGRLESLTHPEAQGNKDLGEPAASGLEITVPRQLLQDAYEKLRAYQKETNGKYPGGPLMKNLMPALQAALAAAPTSPQPIKGESRFTAACKAADAILAPMTAEFGRILEEAPTQPVTVSICSYSVEIPAKKFMDLYDATDRTESELESASNGMGLR